MSPTHFLIVIDPIFFAPKTKQTLEMNVILKFQQQKCRYFVGTHGIWGLRPENRKRNISTLRFENIQFWAETAKSDNSNQSRCMKGSCLILAGTGEPARVEALLLAVYSSI